MLDKVFLCYEANMEESLVIRVASTEEKAEEFLKKEKSDWIKKGGNSWDYNWYYSEVTVDRGYDGNNCGFEKITEIH